MKYQQKVRKKVRIFDYVSENNICNNQIVYKYCGELFRYRYDPVPYTRKRKYTAHPCVRHMKTTQEKRMWFQHKKYVRGKRSSNSLPGAWDDIWHARREKGWKRSKKKHQWA